MGREIERKFLVRGDLWQPSDAGLLIRQGYLSRAPERTVRVRLEGERAFLTVKGPARGGVRLEYEYPIPAEEAREILAGLCESPLIEKRRHRLLAAGRLWEIDVFAGENEGLILAEVELERPDAPLELPPWADREVTEDPRYANSSLVENPFRRWGRGG